MLTSTHPSVAFGHRNEPTLSRHCSTGWRTLRVVNHSMVGAVRALVLGGDTEALLGHTTSWFVVRSLLWSLLILVVFGALSARRFAKL